MSSTGWILVAIAGLSLFGWATFEIGKRQRPEHPTQADNYPSSGTDETNHENGNERTESQKEPTDNLPEVLLVIFTGLLVLATGLLWVATRDLVKGAERIGHQQVQEMKKSNAATIIAAKAAEKGVELARENARLDQRAWVAVTHFRGTPTVNQPYEVRAEFKNTGKTFAKNVRPVFFAYGIPKGENPDFGIVENTKPDGAKFLLPPNGESTAYHKVNAGKPLSPEQFGQIKSGEIVIFAFGKIYYADIFGCEHWVKFSTYLDWGVQGYQAYNEYDDSDDNCGPSLAN